jgi:hypothetical protein
LPISIFGRTEQMQRGPDSSDEEEDMMTRLPLADDPARAFCDVNPHLAHLIQEMDELFAAYVAGVLPHHRVTTRAALLSAIRPLDLLQIAGIHSEWIAEVASFLLAEHSVKRRAGVAKLLAVTPDSIYKVRVAVSKAFRADVSLRVSYHLRDGQEIDAGVDGRNAILCKEVASFREWQRDTAKGDGLNRPQPVSRPRNPVAPSAGKEAPASPASRVDGPFNPPSPPLNERSVGETMVQRPVPPRPVLPLGGGLQPRRSPPPPPLPPSQREGSMSEEERQALLEQVGRGVDRGAASRGA